MALVVTSPPYGRTVHGQVRAEKRAGGGGVHKYDNRYSDDPANLATHGLDDLLAGFTQILAGCAALLRPGGTVVVTARPWRQRGELVDLPGAVLAAGANAGLIPAERCVALLAGLRGQRLIPRPSFFQLDNIRKARARGEPWHLIVHEDVLVFRAPGSPWVRANSRVLGANSGARPRCTGRARAAGRVTAPAEAARRPHCRRRTVAGTRRTRGRGRGAAMAGDTGAGAGGPCRLPPHSRAVPVSAPRQPAGPAGPEVTSQGCPPSP